MFQISEDVMQKYENELQGFAATSAPVEEYVAKNADYCSPCTGCGNNCTGSCAGSCRGNCSGSCQHYSR